MAKITAEQIENLKKEKSIEDSFYKEIISKFPESIP